MARCIVGTNILCENGYDTSLTTTPYFGSSARNIKLDNAMIRRCDFGAGLYRSGFDGVQVFGQCVPDGFSINDLKRRGLSHSLPRFAQIVVGSGVELSDLRGRYANRAADATTRPSIVEVELANLSASVRLGTNMP